MKNQHKGLKAAIAQLRAIASRGAMDTGRQKEFATAISKLVHALDVGDRAMIEKAIDEIARLFIRNVN